MLQVRSYKRGVELEHYFRLVKMKLVIHKTDELSGFRTDISNVLGMTM